MRAPTSKHVVVVGGGIAGLCTAWYALRKGMRVTVLERRDPDHQGCSLGNAGMIVPSHVVPLAAPGMVGTGMRMLLNPESPFSIRPRASADLIRWAWRFWRSSTRAHVDRAMPLLRDLHLASRHCYEDLAEEWENPFGLEKRGLLMLFKTEHALEEEGKLACEARKLGIAAECLTPGQAAKLEPGVRMEIAGAVYYPQDCHLHPGKLMEAMVLHILHAGGEIRYGTDVMGAEVSFSDSTRSEGRIRALRTAGEDILADEFVIAAGSWSPDLLRPLGIRLPMQAGKGYSMTIPNPPEIPRVCSILNEARVAVTPMGSGLRFAGTMEICGNAVSVIPARVRGIVKSVGQYFPSFTAEYFHDAPVWSGLRPCSPDGLPYVGRFMHYDNLYAATGHAMMGISLGPVTGTIMAELLAGERPPLDIVPLSPDRFADKLPS